MASRERAVHYLNTGRPLRVSNKTVVDEPWPVVNGVQAPTICYSTAQKLRGRGPGHGLTGTYVLDNGWMKLQQVLVP
jgi:hypothetical protein